MADDKSLVLQVAQIIQEADDGHETVRSQELARPRQAVPALECRGCGHQWVTRREIDWVGAR